MKKPLRYGPADNNFQTIQQIIINQVCIETFIPDFIQESVNRKASPASQPAGMTSSSKNQDTEKVS